MLELIRKINQSKNTLKYILENYDKVKRLEIL